MICASGEAGGGPGRQSARHSSHHLPCSARPPPVEGKMVWRVDVLVLLLGLLVPALAVENLKKFPILMPHVRPEKVSTLGIV